MPLRETRECFKCFKRIHLTEAWYYNHVDNCSGAPPVERKRHRKANRREDSVIEYSVTDMEVDVQIEPDIQEDRPKVSIN